MCFCGGCGIVEREEDLKEQEILDLTGKKFNNQNEARDVISNEGSAEGSAPTYIKVGQGLRKVD